MNLIKSYVFFIAAYWDSTYSPTATLPCLTGQFALKSFVQPIHKVGLPVMPLNWVYALKVKFNPTIPARYPILLYCSFFSVRFKAFPNTIEFTFLVCNSYAAFCCKLWMPLINFSPSYAKPFVSNV